MIVSVLDNRFGQDRSGRIDGLPDVFGHESSIQTINLLQRLIRRVISLISTGARRFVRSFLCIQRKLISAAGSSLEILRISETFKRPTSHEPRQSQESL